MTKASFSKQILKRLKQSGGVVQEAYGQGPGTNQNETDLLINSSDIILSNNAPFESENLIINVTIINNGDYNADIIVNYFIFEKTIETLYTDLIATQSGLIGPNSDLEISMGWVVDAPAGSYELRVIVENISTSDPEPRNNEGIFDFTIKPALSLTTPDMEAEPGELINLTLSAYNDLAVPADVTINYYFENIDVTTLQNQTVITLQSMGVTSISINFVVDENLTVNQNYTIWAVVVTSSEPGLFILNQDVSIEINAVPEPDTSEEPVLSQMWFIIGLFALILFFATVIASLIGLIPQDRLPIQPALLVMAFIITVIALIGHAVSPRIPLIGPQDLAGMIIIHPITALTAGFLVAGALEAAGAFTAAIDGLGRLEKLKIKGFTVFGIGGTVVILTNIPTIIAMPCGRILAAALMPAALFFGYRVAKSLGDVRMVGVVVFPFIVNAAASCGPSPLGGIGTIGEGMAGLPIGSFTTAQSTGIMMATGVCAMIMRFVTPLKPADLTDEDLAREKAQAESQQIMDESRQQAAEAVGITPTTPAPVAKPVAPTQPPSPSPAPSPHPEKPEGGEPRG
jgi:hypothetical protein